MDERLDSGTKRRQAVVAWLSIALIVLGAGLLVWYRSSNERRQREIARAGTVPLTDPEPTGAVCRAGMDIPCPLDAPGALAVDGEGRIFVGGRGEVVILAADGTLEGRFPVKGDVTCLTLDGAGNVYAATRREVRVHDKDGVEKSAWDVFDAKSVLTSISVAGDKVYVADAGRRAVWVLDAGGGVVRRLVRAGMPQGAFLVPSPYFDVAGVESGGVWVADPGRHELVLYSAEGVEQDAWGKAGVEDEAFCGCCNPCHIALLPGGGFVTGEKGIMRVKRYGREGEYIEQVAGPACFSRGARMADLAVDGGGRILVLDPDRKRIRVFTLGQGGQNEG